MPRFVDRVNECHFHNDSHCPRRRLFCMQGYMGPEKEDVVSAAQDKPRQTFISPFVLR